MKDKECMDKYGEHSPLFTTSGRLIVMFLRDEISTDK